MTNERSQKNQEILEEIKESGEVQGLVGKLNKDKAIVYFNNSQSELDVLESDEFTLKAKLEELKDSSEKELKDKIEVMVQEIIKRKEELSKNSVKAWLVPLQYRDTRIVQTAITEAMLSVEGMNFDNDVKLIMIMQEKKLMTVYLTLRKFDNVNEKYFSSLDEIVKVSNRTLEHLYSEYIKEFLLTDEERKKS